MTPSVHATAAPRLSTLAAPLAVRAAALWILVVSAIKMDRGSPGALPLILRENPLGEDLTFSLTLSVELAFALAALFSTRVGWWLMVSLLGVFLAVLAHLIYIGATSCGCFGGAIKFSPYQMLAVDAPLFVTLLAARRGAWTSKAPSRWFAVAAAFLVGAAAPWIYIDNEPAPAPTPLVEAPQQPAPEPSSSQAPTAAPVNAPAPWTAPDNKPRWVKLRPSEWVGKSIHDTELGVWMDTRSVTDTGNWILYLETCTHCRDFLNWVTASFANDPKVYVLVKLSTDQDAAESIIQQSPPHESGALPPEIQWVVGPELPPWELVLESGVVIEAIHHDVNEAGLDKRKTWRLEAGAVVESQSEFQY